MTFFLCVVQFMNFIDVLENSFLFALWTYDFKKCTKKGLSLHCTCSGHCEIIFCCLNFRGKNAALTKKRSARVTKIYEAKKLEISGILCGDIFQWLSSNKKFVKIRYSQKRLKLLPSTLYSVAISWFFEMWPAHLVRLTGRHSQN